MGILARLFGLGQPLYVRLHLEGVQLGSTGRLAEAKSKFQEALGSAPGDRTSKEALRLVDDALLGRINSETAVRLLRMQQLTDSQHFTAAIEEVKAALAIDPDYPRAHDAMGVLYAWANRIPEAIAALKRAIALDRNCASAHYNLALTYGDQGDFKNAIAEYKEAIRAEPDFGDAHCNLAFCYRDTGQHDLMIAHRDRAVALGLRVNLQSNSREWHSGKYHDEPL